MSKKTVLFAVVILLCSTVCFADDNVQPIATTTVASDNGSATWTPADKDALKEQIGLLRDTLNPEAKQSAVPKEVVVADKALNLLEKLITSVASTIEKMAPDVFRIMYKQQIAKAFGDLIVPWLIFFLTLLYMLLIRKLWKWRGEFNDCNGECVAHLVITAVAPLMLCLGMCIWGVSALSDSIQYLYNPEYYAIKDMINILMGKGQL